MTRSKYCFSSIFSRRPEFADVQIMEGGYRLEKHKNEDGKWTLEWEEIEKVKMLQSYFSFMKVLLTLWKER